MGCEICAPANPTELNLESEVKASRAINSGGVDIKGVNNSLNYIKASTTIPYNAPVESIVQTKSHQIGVGYVNGIIVVYDLLENQTFEQSFTLQGHSGAVESLIKLKDGRLASGSGDNTIKIWRLYERRLEVNLANHSNWVNCIIQMENERLVSCSSDCTICVWDVFKGENECVLRDDQSVNCAVEIGNNQIAANSGDSIKIWNLNTQTAINTIPGAFSTVVTMICFDGKLITGTSNGQIRCFDCNTFKKLFTIKDSENINAIIKIDSNSIASTSGTEIKLWDIKSQVELLTLRGHSDQVHTLCLMDTNQIISGANDKLVKIWGER